MKPDNSEWPDPARRSWRSGWPSWFGYNVLGAVAVTALVASTIGHGIEFLPFFSIGLVAVRLRRR